MHNSRPYKISPPPNPPSSPPVQSQEAQKSAEIEPRVSKSLRQCLMVELDAMRLGTIPGSEVGEEAVVGIERAICYSCGRGPEIGVLVGEGC